MNSSFSEIITERFSNSFIDVYNSISGTGKSKVLKYSPVIFKRWFYSALVNETTLSPSFIYGASLGASSSVTAPAVRPDVTGTRLRGFSVKENRYSPDNHPIVNDLKILVDFCAPEIELDGQNRIIEPAAAKISNFLSLGDPFYVDYLTALAFQLRLLNKSEAVYSNKAVNTSNYTLFKKLNQGEALKKIVVSSIKMCSKRLNSALPKPIPFLSEKGIEALIRKPIAMDEIYKNVFAPFGAEAGCFCDEYDRKRGEQDYDQNNALSSTFSLGVILDKWFITPFGEYLRIIEPVYCFCYNFEDELGYLFDIIKSSVNIDTALFSPCALYSFTPLGRRIFSYDFKSAEKNELPSVTVSGLIGLLDYGVSETSAGTSGKLAAAKEIYSFRVRLVSDKRFWIQVDAADYNTRHELHLEIALNYGFGFSGYSFYAGGIDRSHMPMDEKSKDRGRKADKTPIAGLDLVKGKKMAYISDTGIELEIELIKIISVEKRAHFPQTVKIGKHMRME